MHAQTMTEPVPTRVRAIAQRYPTRIALQESQKILNYQDLDRLADSFANHLLSLGIQRGDVVALCMPRSIDWTVAALGVLRLGAAYVPLDTSWPDARLCFAIQNSGAKAVVAEKPLLDRLHCGIQPIDILDNAWRDLAGNIPSFNSLQPSDLAYVIYTSGSTGDPKGVEITHANLSHLINWHLKDFRVTHNDRTSHLASLGFDAAVWEIWPTLCAGGTLCIVSEPDRLSTDLLQQWLIKEQITISFVPTIQATALIDREWPPQTALRFMLTGADVLSRGPRKRIPFVFVNNYGPTECTVVATSGPVMAGSDGIPTIGKPIRGTEIYLLDADCEPVPDGELGEIYIGGSGVGRGYRNLPEETQFAFLSDPFSFIPGARMYRTGDLAVRRGNGEIEFRGRMDRQVKIYGKRVELNEIDSVLARHPDLSFATTHARVGSRGEIRLIAYVVAKSADDTLSADLLRKHILQTLPSYMVPAHFVRLPSIPLLTNGKLDQKTLDMGSPFGLGTRLMTGNQSQLGDRLLALMRELLNDPALSKEDNFFLAGGHSLLGMQLILRIEEEFGAELSLQQILEYPTVNQLSAEIEWALDSVRKTAEASPTEDSHVKANRNGVKVAHRETQFGESSLLTAPSSRLARTPTGAPLSPMNALPPGVAVLKRNTNRGIIFWIHYVHGNLAWAMGNDYGFFVIRLTLEDLAAMGRWPSAQAIARCMVKKILQIQPAGPFVIGGMCLGGILAYEIASQIRAAGHEVSLLVMVDASNPRYRPEYRAFRDISAHAKYLVDRARKLGVQNTLQFAYKDFTRQLPKSFRRAFAKTQLQKTQEIVEAAGLSYRPQRYSGSVLLLLASDCAPHDRPEEGWRDLVDGPFTSLVVDGHHSELARPPAVVQIAEFILSHLDSAPTIVKQAEPVGADKSQTGGVGGALRLEYE
jgi:amino acid adenylation domain-containing protein